MTMQTDVQEPYRAKITEIVESNNVISVTTALRTFKDAMPRPAEGSEAASTYPTDQQVRYLVTKLKKQHAT